MQGNEELKKRQMLSAQIDLSKFNKGDFIKATEEEKKQEEFLSGKLRSYEENLTALSEYNELIPVAAEDRPKLPHGAVLADLFRRPRSAECLWVCCREKWQKTRKMRNSVRNKTDY